VGGGAEYVEVVDYFVGKGDWRGVSLRNLKGLKRVELTSCSVEEFVKEDLDGIEPVQSDWLRTCSDSDIVVTLAKVPQANLVKVVETD
jgi:hypothetical protein